MHRYMALWEVNFNRRGIDDFKFAKLNRALNEHEPSNPSRKSPS